MPVALVLLGVMATGLAYYMTRQLLPRLDSWLEIQAVRYAKPEPVKVPDPMPSDIAALALAYPEDWARADTIKRLEELYDESGDWDRVRQVATSLRIGES